MTQWTQSVGRLSFNGDTCKISYQDRENPKTCFLMQLHAPFSPEDNASHLVRPTTAHAKIAITSNLLRQRLDHCSIEALGIASKSELWADASLTPD